MTIFVIKLITYMKKVILLTLAVAVLAACQSPQQKAEKRASDILKQLTLEEKASLMVYNSPAVERLGIRSYNWWNEALHGVARNGAATVFPMPIAMAASFDEPLLEEVFTVVSDEARIKHKMAAESGWYQGLTFWTPNINIFRDPRWGRGMETYGEDPYLTGVMGMAVVRGLQGDPKAPVKKLHACAKHLAVHSGTEKNRHHFDAEVSERDIRETYLPAFKDLVTKAGVEEVMTAYNRFRGVPCGASSYLVNDILRGEWGYKGMVVSDCWALDDFYMEGRHGYVKTGAETAAVAVKNGRRFLAADASPLALITLRKRLLAIASSPTLLDEPGAAQKPMTLHYPAGRFKSEVEYAVDGASVLISEAKLNRRPSSLAYAAIGYEQDRVFHPARTVTKPRLPLKLPLLAGVARPVVQLANAYGDQIFFTVD